MRKNIVIYGSGKIGRGFVADVFHTAGYHITFVDCNEALVNSLRKQGKYTLYNVASAAEKEKKIIDDFDVMFSGEREVTERIQKAGFMAIVTFVDAFTDVAKTVVSVLKKKFSENDSSAFDVIVFANVVGSQKLFKKAVYDLLDGELREFADKVLGIAGTVVLRVAVEPTAEMKAEDALTVLTDGYHVLPMSSDFKGPKPDCPMIEYHDSLDIPELRKLYTYNMAHAAAAYLGRSKGCATIAEALGDREIEQIVRGALEEIEGAFVREGHGREDEVKGRIERVIQKFKNPLLRDTPARVGKDPVRKLGRSDRLVGAALMARRNGIYPYYLTKIIAYGFMFDEKTDAAAGKIQKYLSEKGLDAAVRNFTGLNESDMIYNIKRHYVKADGKFVAEDQKRVAFLHRAYQEGFKAEKQYKGCAQCALIGMGNLMDNFNKELFQASTGFSGGMALCGDGVCGGYSGGILFMGLYKGRNFDRMVQDGDKENQYIAYDCAQALHDHYINCYGSPVCSRVHEGMFQGEHFVLRTKARRNEFEAAGAHQVVCTSVVALACTWIAEIMLDHNLYKL